MVDIATETLKKELEKTYIDTCNIYTYSNSEDDIVVDFEETLKYENIKCALSYISSYAKEDVKVTSINSIKLFLSNEYDIPVGSRIEVKHFNKTYNYAISGSAAVYDTHQELNLMELKNG